MPSAQHYKETAFMILDAYRSILNGNASVEEIGMWVDLGNTVLQAAAELFQSKLPVADKQKLQAATAIIKTALQLFREHRVGGRLSVEQASTSHESVKSVTWEDLETAFEGRIRTGVISNTKHLDFKSFIQDAQCEFIAQIKKSLEEHASVKVNSVLAAEYQIIKNSEYILEVKYFNTKSVPIYTTTDLHEWFLINVQRPIDTDMEEFQEKESGWSLQSILNLTVNINRFNPIRGSSFIKLPEFILRKKACINVINNDNQCFKWAILSALHYNSSNPTRISSYIAYENELNFDGLEFPVDVRQVGKFEKQNNISINVYFLKKRGSTYKVLPRHLTTEKQIQHINLLLIENSYIDEEEEEHDDIQEYIWHYVWIKDLSRLVKSQASSHKSKAFICDRCMHMFWTKEKLCAHTNDCEKMNECKIILPSKRDSILQFKNFAFTNRVPYVVYADFECILKPIDNGTRAYQQHDAFSVGYFVRCSYDDAQSQYNSYRQMSELDETPAKWFVHNLHNLACNLEDMHKNPKPMNSLTLSQTINYDRARHCHICRKPFSEADTKVRDHCHFTGVYRGPAHSSCNLNYQDSRVIPVIFHNLSGYDSHIFIKEIATSFPGRVSLLPVTKEKYISFTKFVEGTDISLRFIDSFRFMPSSIEKLASYLESHDTLEQVFIRDDAFTQEKIALLKRKGVFPYDYVSSFDKLKETTLPPRADFYSILYDSNITDEEYEHARNVWHKFNIQNLGQYSDLYLKTDVLLLTEIFENFRSSCLQAYDLDPAHYYTTPGLTWDAMLKYTQVKLELLTDIDMLMFIERGIRGGISQCCNRYAKANNKYMGEDYDPRMDDKYLMYFDVNNLYGWAMTEPLPYGSFEWVENLDQSDFFNVPDDHEYGYILEVDLEYSEDLHDAHKDLPFCAEHLAPPECKQKKLMTTLYDKKFYVLHYRALKQALQHGLQLKKIHRALRFRQSKWLKSYIDLNSEKRKNAKNEFEKMFFKLFNNAVYGKTMENQRKHLDVKLVSKWNGRYGAEALISRPNFHNCSIFSENLAAVQLTRSEIRINKPIYIGLSVLDLSKTLVFRFHYEYMKSRVGDLCKLLYTDTDSLIYEVTNINMYDVMKRDINEFDTSDYAVNNQFGMPLVNKKIVGLMKDECNGDIMLEFVGLRSKMYSIRVQNQRVIKKAKGVKSSVVKASICFEDYIKCLRENIQMSREQCNIRSRLHQIYTEKEVKIALSAHDDKRFLRHDTTDTLPWGHYMSQKIIAPPSPQRVVGDALYEEECLSAAHSSASGENRASSSSQKRPQLEIIQHQPAIFKKFRQDI